MTAVTDWATSKVRCKGVDQDEKRFLGDEEQGGGLCVAGHCPRHLWLLQDLLQQALPSSDVTKVNTYFHAGAVSS